MAGIKISALPAVTNALLTDFLPVVQGGITSQETLAQIATLFNSNLTYLPLAGGTLTGPLILNTNTPTTALQAASKGYVDSVAQGLTIQGACRVATTGALTATYNNVSVSPSGVGATLTNSGTQAALVIDGVTLALNDRVLVKNQGTTLQNGIYTATNLGSVSTNWVLTRATDYDDPSQVQAGDLVVITAGTTNTNSSWLETSTVTSIGVSAITFSQFSASLPISLSNGGTGASLTASNGGIFYSGASAGTILAGTATAGLTLLSGASGAPTWSTLPPLSRVNVQTFSASGTYTPTVGTKYALIELEGGGGGSGGIASGVGAISAAAGGGGGSPRGQKLVTIAQIGANATITIGAGGAAGAAGNNTGGTGGTTTVALTGAGTLSITSTGGWGGFGATTGATTVTTNAGGAGGTVTNCDIPVVGFSGGNGINQGILLGGIGGKGADSAWGQGGVSAGSTNGSGSGAAGVGFGSGASGAYASQAGTLNLAGTAGQPGYVIITEYISV